MANHGLEIPKEQIQAVKKGKAKVENNSSPLAKDNKCSNVGLVVAIISNKIVGSINMFVKLQTKVQ